MMSPSLTWLPAASKKMWPLQKGFDRFYGFIGGETNQWYPDLVEDNHYVEQPYGPEEGYHFSKDLADKAIEYLKDQTVWKSFKAMVSCGFARVPIMPRITARRNISINTKASSMTATKPTASGCCRA